MVVFLDNPEKYNSPTMMAQLDREVSEIFLVVLPFCVMDLVEMYSLFY